jgi:cell division protein ZapA
MKSLVEVEIFGQTFTVNSEEQTQYVKELADYVDQRMRQIAGSTKTVVPLRVAIMAALSIADEWYKANQREQEIQEETERLSAVLLERIEQSEKNEDVSNGRVVS